MPLHDIHHLEIHEVCNPSEPAVDTWLYTHGLHGGLGPELAVASRPDPDHDTAVRLNARDLEHCLRLWASAYASGLPLGDVILHDGLVSVQPIGIRTREVAALERGEQAHLCFLDEDATLEVVAWTANLQTSLLEHHQPDPTMPRHRLSEVLRTDPNETTNPARVLLNHFDPDHATMELVGQVARIGALGAIQLHKRIGASTVLTTLRNLTEELDLEVAGVRALATDTARSWAQLLWPPDAPDFERRWHLPSVALAHNLEATALALHLFPAVPLGTFIGASMTTMWVLTDARWGRATGEPETITDLGRELMDLPAPAWESIADCFQHETAPDSQTVDALATWLGIGRCAPVARDFRYVLASHLTEPVLSRVAAAAADLAVCRLVGVQRTDPLATVLAARSLFDT